MDKALVKIIVPGIRTILELKFNFEPSAAGATSVSLGVGHYLL
jgi:hypothetical protein